MNHSPLQTTALFHIGPVAITEPVIVTWAIMVLLVLFAVAAQSLFLVFLTVFLFNHADPKGDGMEMVASGAAFMLIFLPLSLPAFILAK